jgi:hypothetical protein
VVSIFSGAFADMLGSVARSFLQHTCTLTIYSEVLDAGEPVLDDEGHPTYTESSVSGVKCLFLWQDTSRTDERGTIVESTPTLYVDQDQALSVGDLIENVLTPDGTNILKAGRIQTINPTAEGGDLTLKVCLLEGAQV